MNKMPHAVCGVVVLELTLAGVLRAEATGSRIDLRQAWFLSSSAVGKEEAAVISNAAYQPRDWYAVSVPTKVRSALTRHGVYPDMRIGINACQTHHSSDEFDARYDLGKFSHLPDKRNPWWFRKQFTLPRLPADRQVWLRLTASTTAPR